MPIRLWLSEIAGLGLVALAIWSTGDALEAVLASAWLLILLGLFQTDMLCLRLPDVLTLPLFATGVGIGLIERGATETAIAAALGPAALWLIGAAYRRHRGKPGLGFGDVKMMAGLSAAVGPFAIPWLTLVAALSALCVALVRQLGHAEIAAGTKIAFGCHLAVAGALVWLVIAWFGPL